MEKPATTPLAIHPVIKKRWSPRSFQPEQGIEKEKLERILEAARWAPSGFNEQPWRFIVGEKGNARWNALFESLVEFNQQWAKQVPLLILILGKKTLTKSGKPNRTYQYDTGGCVAYMTFQAVSEGLMTHQMGGFNKEKIMNRFQISDDYEAITIVAIGYQDQAGKLEDEELQKRELAPRERLEVKELLLN